MKDLWYTFLGKAFSLFAQVMVKIQPIWEKYKIWISIALGIAIGLVLGLGPLTPTWENASPGSLRADYRSHYLAYVAQNYVQTNDTEMVKRTLGLDLDKNRQIPWTYRAKTLPADIQTAIDNAADPRFQLNMDKVIALQRLAQDLEFIRAVPETTAPEGTEEGGRSWLQAIGTLLLLLLLALGAVAAVWFLLINRRRPSEEPEPEVYETIDTGVTAAPGAAVGEVTPVKSFTTTYMLGDDYFDPSFSIEIGPDFLGECGIGVSETIGAGDPKKVTAFEVWLFDKSDIRTVTTVLASEYAINDADLYAKLEPKGEVQQLQPGAEIIIETTALRITARVKELEYAQGNLPTHSFIQKASFELRAWVKANDGGAVAA